MLLDILKSFLIGICASAPMGPIAILVIQKSLSEGHRAGFLTGIGACLVDTIFAIIAVFAWAKAEHFMNKNEILILIIGGIIVAGMGASMAIRNPFRGLKPDTSKAFSVKDMFKAVIMGISNPGAILVIFALFSLFGIEIEHHDFRVAPLIISLSLGATSYWFLFSWLFSHFRKHFKISTIILINRISGVILIIIGLALLAEGIFKYYFHL